ncbi:hypothetical protein EDD29_8575 [Actinocorallia herbida]|uniref:Uncharacterized protein n=2 Tax=Actinocorallia herbida TaxID=58109 RepID=A0A3N1DBJ0_9ACTN|nr:hypothetical protein EDD29_8575 [Actinocorallia herbida]
MCWFTVKIPSVPQIFRDVGLLCAEPSTRSARLTGMSDVAEMNWYETEQVERPRRKRRWIAAGLFAFLVVVGVVVVFAGLAGAGEVPGCGGG